MELKVECDECKYEFNLNASNVLEKHITVREDGKEIIITYYECPQCHKVFVVQIDTEETKNLLVDVRKLMHEASNKKSKKQQFSKKKSAKGRNLINELDDMRKNLAVIYDGCHYIEDGNEVKLTMSMLS
jgi:hypothetical protein